MNIVILVQGGYYILTGLWAIFNISSFQKVTGQKTDKWLVYMVGLLAAVIGFVLLQGDSDQTSIKLLGVLSATSFALVDFIFSLKRTISKIYLADGFLQIIFIIGWLMEWQL